MKSIKSVLSNFDWCLFKERKERIKNLRIDTLLKSKQADYYAIQHKHLLVLCQPFRLKE
jgi:hypothetical protein